MTSSTTDSICFDVTSSRIHLKSLSTYPTPPFPSTTHTRSYPTSHNSSKAQTHSHTHANKHCKLTHHSHITINSVLHMPWRIAMLTMSQTISSNFDVTLMQRYIHHPKPTPLPYAYTTLAPNLESFFIKQHTKQAFWRNRTIDLSLTKRMLYRLS